MKTYIMKWEDSLAIKLPAKVIDELNLHENDVVTLNVCRGCLVITPITSRKSLLMDMLNNITEQNKHSEIHSG